MSTIIDVPSVNTRVYNAGTLSWESAKQPVLNTDTVAVTLAGVSTAAGQTTGNSSLASILTELQSILTKLNASLAVTGTFYQATQPISAASLPLPSGAATQVTLAAIDASTAKLQLSIASGTVSGTGNNTIITPSAGKKLRLSYVSYNPSLAIDAGFRFGAAGTLFMHNSIAANGVIAKDFGDMRYIEGAIDEVLILNMVVGVSTIWNALYIEV